MDKDEIIKQLNLTIRTLTEVINSLEDDNKSLKEVAYNLAINKK